MTIKRIDSEVLEHVGLPAQIQELLDSVGKRRLIVLLLDGQSARDLDGGDSDDKMSEESFRKSASGILHDELESRYFQRWDLNQSVAVRDGDRVWVAGDVHEWAFKSRASRLLHEVNRSTSTRRRSRRRRA
jgi:hypothetical protein